MEGVPYVSVCRAGGSSDRIGCDEENPLQRPGRWHVRYDVLDPRSTPKGMVVSRGGCAPVTSRSEPRVHSARDGEMNPGLRFKSHHHPTPAGEDQWLLADETLRSIIVVYPSMQSVVYSSNQDDASLMICFCISQNMRYLICKVKPGRVV